MYLSFLLELISLFCSCFLLCNSGTWPWPRGPQDLKRGGCMPAGMKAGPHVGGVTWRRGLWTADSHLPWDWLCFVPDHVHLPVR